MCAAEPTRTALDVAMEHSLRFVQERLPDPCGRVLEVGCGTGRLAQQLQGRAREFVAIDIDPENVRLARERGVDGRVAGWIGFDGGMFDAILFTRSLHHIEPLDVAVRRAAQSLATGGDLIVDDFAYSDASATQVGWLIGVLRKLAERKQVDLTHSEFLARL